MNPFMNLFRFVALTVAVILLCLLVCVKIGNAEWIDHPPIRKVSNYGPVVTDVESHLEAGHVFRDKDKITWTHEGTHGVNSLLRREYRKPGFYALNNRAYLLAEPNTTIERVANAVPKSLRGRIYQTYCIDQRRWWNEQPSYLYDEWICYLNGTVARTALGIKERRETSAFMLEMAIYSSCIILVEDSYDENRRVFLKWLWEQSIANIDDDAPLVDLRTNADAARLRQAMRVYFGTKWTQETLGF